MTDLQFAIKCEEQAKAKTSRRARRLLALYIAGRKPAVKQLEEYEIMLQVERSVKSDVLKIFGFECEVASFKEDQ